MATPMTSQRNTSYGARLLPSEPVAASVIRALDRGARKHFGDKYLKNTFQQLQPYTVP